MEIDSGKPQDETGPESDMLSSIKRVRKGGVWAVLGSGGIAFFGFLVSALLARVLTPDDMGRYFLTYTLVSIGALVGQLGLDRAVVRLIAESIGSGNIAAAKSSIVKVTIWVGLGATGVAAALNLGVGQWIVETVFKDGGLAEYLWWVGVWIIVLALETVFANIFRGLHDIRLAVTFSGLVRGGLTALTFAIVWTVQGHTDLSEVIVLSACAGAASMGAASLLVWCKTRELEADSTSRVSGLFLIAAPLLVHALLLYVVNQVNLWILGAFRPHEEVALYGAAARLVMLVGMSTSVVNAVVPPLIAEKYAQGKLRDIQNLLRSAATVCGAPAVLVLLVYLFAGDWFLGAVYGDFYRGATIVLVILSIAEIVNVITGPCSVSLVMTGHQVPIMALTIIRALVTIFGSIAVVNTYGLAGVALVYAIGLIAYNIASLVLARRMLGIWTHAGIFSFGYLFRK